MSRLTSVSVRDFRCFRDEQTVRLAPLTLLVGDNSTGKTSFLAFIRALWRVTQSRKPDFAEEPFDLGSFDEIAHHRGSRGGRAETFQGELRHEDGISARFTFGRDGTAPFLLRRRLTNGSTWIEEGPEPSGDWAMTVGGASGSCKIGVKKANLPYFQRSASAELLYSFPLLFTMAQVKGLDPLGDGPSFSQAEKHAIRDLLVYEQQQNRRGVYASAPVRFKPRRTYDPAQSSPDGEGAYAPMLLAQIQDKEEWKDLKGRLEEFGSASGLFDEITLRRIGRKEGGPIQVQVRKYGKKLKGPRRNLIDVGSGVSQALAIITELFQPDAAHLFLFQQPEVHLHPSAQAAMGSMFCQVASSGRQLLVETHSDHVIDRVRMDVRDRKVALEPKDVLILYFDRNELAVRIHEITLDENGNIDGEPSSYRSFFMEETRRALRL